MIIVLYGPNSYLRQKKLNKVVEEYKKKYSGLSYDYFDLNKSGEFLKLKEFSGQSLLFDNKKMAILKNLYEIDLKEAKDFLKTYMNSKDFTILISEDKALPLEFAFLKKKAFSIEKFDNLKGDKWNLFIQKETRKRGLVFTPRALNFLIEEYKNDIWGLINELEKLDLFFIGKPERTSLDLKEINEVGDYHYKSPNIFIFINAIINNKDVSQKIIALEKLFISQEEPVKIFNILASMKRLPGKLIQKMAHYDVLLKSGKIGYEDILLYLAL
ncbi:hypothetical protein JW698_01005 [Candidatus Wolfebacteria bacterium]|nr:hypothetical protein [Candidatus Wolfebacteria bacterium]